MKNNRSVLALLADINLYLITFTSFLLVLMLVMSAAMDILIQDESQQLQDSWTNVKELFLKLYSIYIFELIVVSIMQLISPGSIIREYFHMEST